MITNVMISTSLSATGSMVMGGCGWFSCHKEHTAVGHLEHGVRVLDVWRREISVFSLPRKGGGGGN